MTTPNPIPISRRQFFKIMGATGTSLVVGIYLSGCQEPSSQTGTVAPVDTLVPTAVPPTEPPILPTATPTDEATPEPIAANADAVLAPNIYLEINANGQVAVTAFQSEMGQGIRTAIAMILAEELDIPWEAVKTIEQAKADPAFGDQVTGGSLSVSRHFMTLRRAGAVARRLLINAAAQHWQVEPDACSTQPGFVVHPNGQDQLAYGQLVAAASLLEVPRTSEVTLKPISEFRILGQRLGNWDAADMITGRAIFGSDFRMPDMAFAAIARCPTFGGRATTFDASDALQISGVQSVERIGDVIAVIADNSWAAFKGRDALVVEWDEGETGALSSEIIYADLARNFPESEDEEEDVLTAVYDIPFQAHMTMEPMNCTAYIHDGICEVWAPTQNPQGVHNAIVREAGFRSEDVTVHVLLMGGGFGRRLNVDYAVEAVLVAKTIGHPVQVVWSRNDDVQHDFYHPMSRHYASVDLNNIADRSIRNSASRDIPVGDWRSVSNFAEAFAQECFFDEIAHALDRDPYELRMEHYDERARTVLELVAAQCDWGSPLPDGWGRGIAYHASFGVTHVAQVAEVEVSNTGVVRVHRVFCAVDCGLVINPNGAEAQIEGGIVFGLTAALKAKITVENGRIQQSNFHDCPILTFDEMPQIDVAFVESERSPFGLGEMGVPPIAPAVANAVFAATGKRIRHIPIMPEDLAR